MIRFEALIVVLTAVASHITADNVSDMIRTEGYPVECHHVHTADNYTVGLHRIPPSATSGNRTKVFLLMHGLANSAADWLLFGRRHSLAYLLADAGHDVWLGNARGTRASRGHRTLDADRSERYWDFSFHEIGVYDVPAMVEYVLAVAGRPALHYVGHSQGCTTFFIALAQRPVAFAAQIVSMHALAPAVYLGQSRATQQLILDNISTLHRLAGVMHVSEFSTRRPFFRQVIEPLLRPLCADGTLMQVWCVSGVFRLIDTESPSLSARRADIVVANTLDSISVRQLVHFGQFINSGEFQHFDYGPELNRRRYGGRATPLPYGLANRTVDVFAMFGDADFITPAVGVGRMTRELGAGAVERARLVPGFNHFDFVWSRRARSTVYRQILRNVRGYGR